MENLKVAIVYDWLDKWGGAERLLLNLKEIFPNAIFYTSYHDKNETKWLNKVKIKESFLSYFPAFVKKNRLLSLPFYPFVFESFNFSGFDLVISLTAYFSKSVITKPGTFHISYILTPPRFLYFDQGEYINPSLKKFLNPYLSYLKRWDRIASQRSDLVLTISKEVKKRIKQIYRLESKVLYPPFNIKYWDKIKKKVIRIKTFKKFKQFINNSFFLFVGRLEPYKKVDLFIKVASYFPNFQFIVVGKGSQKNKLKTKSLNNVIFLQDLIDEELGFLYSKAQALIVPQREEFGYVGLEAIFFNLPVIYFEKGGMKEIVGDLGVSFERQDLKSLKTAIEKYITLSYNVKNSIILRKSKVLEQFSKEKFKQKFKNLLNFI